MHTHSPIRPIVITGPTASGKSQIAMGVAAYFKGAIVGADSMQIYRDLQIGTAKPSSLDRSTIPHYLVDCIDLSQNFSVAEYLQMAQKILTQLSADRQQAIICGGTGLYISGLVNGNHYNTLPVDDQLRQSLNKQAQSQAGIERLYQKLQALDPEAAKNIHPNNVKRIIRAIEINQMTKGTKGIHQPFPANHQIPKESIFVITHDRDTLYRRINQRVDQMIESGLLEELEMLIQKQLPLTATCWQAIGYKEFLPYIHHEQPLDTCIDHLKQATRRYAKRQLTWFKHQFQARWLINLDPEDAIKQICQTIETSV